MTSDVISDTQTTTENLPAEFDDLLVTSSGSIIVTTSEGVGINATANSEEITIDGLVYSVDASNIGVSIAGQSTSLDVSGQVQADVGVNDGSGGSFDRISVASQGAIDGGVDGVVLTAGKASDPTATGNSLDNAGDVSGLHGVIADYGGDDLIDNSGQIWGGYGVDFVANVDTETVENSGTIAGGADETDAGPTISTIEGAAGIDIVNSGLLTGSEAGGNVVLYFSDNPGTTSTIANTGSISGQGYAIQSFSDILDISNSGTIDGGLDSLAAVDITANSGLWEASAGSATAFTLSAADDSITNSTTGAIDGGIDLVSGGDTITNAGGIDGPITFTGSGNTNSLTNSGKITGAVALSGGYNTVDNSGLIDGEVSMAHSHDTLSNAGTVDGAVALTAGSDTFTNTGAIAGEVVFWSTGTTNTFTNSGNIGGSVTLSAEDSSLTNNGLIYGNVVLGSDDTLTNTGTIHGSVTLGGSDTFAASGNFGQVTFDDFVAGTGSTHDRIQFAANDFGTFSQVQAASSQVGSDVVIKLDASDSITLTSVTLSSLTSADFAFV